MKNFVRTCIVCAFLSAPTAVWAVHPLEVEDTATQGKGNYLFELNGDYLKDNGFKTTKINGVITAGAGVYTDLTLEVPYLMLNPSATTDKNEQGTGDIRFKLKQRFFENEVHQSMAYMLYAVIPSGDSDKGLGKDNIVWGVKLMDSQGCCSNIFHVNAGYEVFGRDLKKIRFGDDYTINFGLAVEHKITEPFRFLTELKGENRREAGQYSRPFTYLAGFKYDISRFWYVDLAARAGLNKYAEDYAALMGTAWRF